eukprot:SAG22_NODE_259_length_13477_cov_10.020407_8_plen_89_part_00
MLDLKAGKSLPSPAATKTARPPRAAPAAAPRAAPAGDSATCRPGGRQHVRASSLGELAARELARAVAPPSLCHNPLCAALTHCGADNK